MAKGISFNFGANARPRKPRSSKGGKGKKSRGSGKSNAWRSYVGTAPLPD